MADIGIVVSKEKAQGGMIGRITKIYLRRGKGEYEETRRYDLLSEEAHMTIVVEGIEDWQRGVICLSFSIAERLAKAMLSTI